MRTLVLSPHTDDAELGAGGTVARLVEEKYEVWSVAFSTAESVKLRLEFMNASKALELDKTRLIAYEFPRRDFPTHRQAILQHLIYLRDEIKPELVLMPSLKDVHQDHRVLAQECLRAFKATTVWGYELLWNTPSFRPTHYVVLEKWHVDKKYMALSQYKTQVNRFYFDEELILAWARVRGVQVGVRYAEAFEYVRGIKPLGGVK